jgi:hypothetical protein
LFFFFSSPDSDALKPTSLDDDYDVVRISPKSKDGHRPFSAGANSVSVAGSGKYQRALQRKQKARVEAKDSSPERPSASYTKPNINAEACRLSKLLASYESQDGKPSLVQSATQGMDISTAMKFISMIKRIKQISIFPPELLFKTMRHLKSSKTSAPGKGKGKGSPRTTAESKEFFNGLSAPRQAAMYQNRTLSVATKDPTQLYAKYEDAQECTFKPKITGLKNNTGG